MRTLFKQKLAFRTAVTILAVVLSLGSLVIVVEVSISSVSERESQNRQLENLLSTVVKTTSVAVFLSDEQLAKEIAEGLAGNDIVAEVTISTDEKVLAKVGKPVTDNRSILLHSEPQQLIRVIHSPFVPDEAIGEISLVSNPAVIAEKLRKSVISTLLIQLAEVFLAGLCTVLVVMRLITKPITTISNRLHRLNVTLGEKIPMPSNLHRQDEIGQLVHDVNVMIDRVVTLLGNERVLRQDLEVNERKFRSIFENATSAIFVVDDKGMLQSYNAAFLTLFHVSSTAIASSPVIYSMVDEYDEKLSELISRTLACNSNEEIEIRIGIDKPIWIKMVLSPGLQNTVQIVANEITSFKKAFSEVEKEITTDALTGIGNRRGVENRLARLLDPVQNKAANASAVFFMDLDHFKEVNDTYGHQAGDTVLIKVAEIVQKLIRKTDYSARSGGDEFILVLENIDDLQICARLAEDLLAEIGKPLTINPGVAVTVGISIGIACGKPGVITPEELMKQADSAMYQAKENGRHQYRFYSVVD